MSRIFLLILFFTSIVFLPWWIAVFLAVLLIAYEKAYLFVFVGGLILDSLYGAPIAVLSNTSYLYSIVFLLLIAMSALLKNKLLD